MGTKTDWSSVSRIAGSASTVCTALASRSAMGAGRPAGPQSRNQFRLTTPANPASRAVGTSGSATARSGEETHRPRRFPARVAAALPLAVSHSEVVTPPSTACCASGAPRNGAWRSCARASIPNSTPLRWPMEPTPEEPKLKASARARAAAP